MSVVLQFWTIWNENWLEFSVELSIKEAWRSKKLRRRDCELLQDLWGVWFRIYLLPHRRAREVLLVLWPKCIEWWVSFSGFTGVRRRWRRFSSHWTFILVPLRFYRRCICRICKWRRICGLHMSIAVLASGWWQNSEALSSTFIQI